MSKRITAVAASALALALGCEQQAGRTGEDDQIVGQQEEQVTEEETGFNQEPAEQRRQQQMQQRQQAQQGQQGQQMGQGSPGQIVTEQSQNNLDRTLSQLNRQLRENDFDVVATVRYDQRMRERAMREQGQQGQQQARQQQQRQQQQGMQQGMQQGGQGQEIGDVRMILFRRTNEEAQAIESQGPEALLKAPRALLVYERGENVIVSYQTPEDMPAVGMEEPTTEVLQRIVRESTQGRQPATAQREQQQQEQQAQRTEQEAQGMEQQAQREQQQAQREQQQAQGMEQQAQREQQQAERERQAMIQRQREEQAGVQN